MELQRLHQRYWHYEGLDLVVLGLWSPVPAEEHAMWGYRTHSRALHCSVFNFGLWSTAPTERKWMSSAAPLQQQSLQAEGVPDTNEPAWHAIRG